MRKNNHKVDRKKKEMDFNVYEQKEKFQKFQKTKKKILTGKDSGEQWTWRTDGKVQHEKNHSENMVKEIVMDKGEDTKQDMVKDTGWLVFTSEVKMNRFP